MPKPSFTLIKEKIKAARHILVAAHVKPDFDALVSVLALGAVLRKLGKNKKASLFIPQFHAEKWGAIDGAEKIKSTFPKEKVDLVFGLDYAKMERLGVEKILERDRPYLISVDHHPLQDQRGDILWVDFRKSSVAEMVFELARAWNVTLKSSTAQLLLLGIVGDTAGLATDKVTPEVLRIVAELVGAGADLPKTQMMLEEWESTDDFILLSRIGKRAKADRRLRFIVSTVTERDQRQFPSASELSSRIVNLLRAVRGMKIALVLVREKNYWYGHLRSRAESKIDLGKVAQHFGGGGHFHAAGFRTTLPAPKIIRAVKNLLETKENR